MTPTEAAYRLVSGGRSLRSEDLRSAMRELEREHGSKTAAARAAGVGRETWRRWGLGSQAPRPSARDRLRAAQRRARLSPARERKIREGGRSVILVGQIRVSSDTRDREIDIGDSLDGDALVDAFLSGDDLALTEELGGAVSDYVAGMQLEDVGSVRLE